VLENIFLIYANYSFRDDPENLNKVFDEIIPHLNPDRKIDEISAEFIVKNIISFVKYDNPIKAKNLLLKITHNGKSPLTKELKEAFNVVYEYRNGYCPNKCLENWGNSFYDMFHINELKDEPRLKCYECRQLFFISLLSKIASGQNFNEIIYCKTVDEQLCQYDLERRRASPLIWENVPLLKVGDKRRSGFGIDSYFDLAFEYINTKIVITDSEKLEKVSFLDSKNLYDFNKFLVSVVGYSLFKFLLEKDRRQLKICEECNKFYITKTLRKSKFCSDRCRLALNNRERIRSGKAKEYKRKRYREGKYNY